MKTISRRLLLTGGVAAGGAVAGAAIHAVGQRFGLIPADSFGKFGPGQTLVYAAHRLFGRHAMAREFPRSMISAKPFANPVAAPTAVFKRHQETGFANWRLKVHGLVARPQSFSIGELRALETRSQITETVCEEGWSYVAEWTGTTVAAVLNAVGVRPGARYLVYSSTDPDWWESIDIDEAMHPQTLMAWNMNGRDLPVPFGGPLRMRVPRQLAYKSVKFLNRLVVTDTLEGFGNGSGQSWANYGYAWYAGI